MTVRPEDILPEETNSMSINGITVRKATVAAILANAKRLASGTLSEIEKSEALAVIKELAPAVVAIELHKHVTWNNPEIQKIIEQAAEQ